MSKIDKKTLDEKEQMIESAKVALGRLGHKGTYWQLGPRPQISLYVYSDCKHCGKRLRCQKSLCTSHGTHYMRLEFVVGEFLVLLQDENEQELIETDMYSNAICSRMAALL